VVRLVARKTTSSKDRGLTEGYRSGLEGKIGDQLSGLGLPVLYEVTKVKYTPPLKQRTYSPDFLLPNGIIIETKGRFVTDDRQKHKAIKAEHPDLDIRFVFSRSKTKISKTSKTSYGDWCDKYGFTYADVWVPSHWISLPPDPVRIKALEAATGMTFADIMRN
jgi:hypothetical protein